MKRRWWAASGVGGIGAIVLLVVGGPMSPLGWSAVSHSECQVIGASLETLSAWIPALIVQAPYGGMAWGNASVPAGSLSYPEGSSNGYQSSARDGGSTWSGFLGEINISSLQNVTVLGDGADVTCRSAHSVTLVRSGGVVLGAPLLGPGNESDVGEPSTLGYFSAPGEANVSISVGFTDSSGGDISTCSEAAESSEMVSVEFGIDLPGNQSAHSAGLSDVLPITESFHYTFPANYGVWQIDNLSAAGGPGGGWAFSYSPCP